MLRAADRLRMKTMIGCMIESVVGISAIAQLAGLADYLDLDNATVDRQQWPAPSSRRWHTP